MCKQCRQVDNRTGPIPAMTKSCGTESTCQLESSKPAAAQLTPGRSSVGGTAVVRRAPSFRSGEADLVQTGCAGPV